mgnify:CR=1 FL=1
MHQELPLLQREHGLLQLPHSFYVVVEHLRMGLDHYIQRAGVHFHIGLGETEEQIGRLLDDVLAVGCDILTIGQYLQPSPEHYPLARYRLPRFWQMVPRLHRAGRPGSGR